MAAMLALTLLIIPIQAEVQPVDRYVTVDGLRIHYLDWGSPEAQPLVLLHGIGRIAHTFDPVAAQLAGAYHVLAVDMRGHGDSAWDPEGRYRVEDYVLDIEGLAEALDLRDIVLWGNSTGGRVVQVFAARNPERTAAVISEDVGPERPATIARSLAGRIEREERGWASKDELLAEQIAANRTTSEAVLQAYVEYGSKVRQSDGRIVWKRDPAINDGFVPTDQWRFVREIRAPVIYILGGRSTIVPPETQDELRRALPQVEIVTMPGLGHYPSEEDPDGFLRIVREFLD
jgi:pimeloyl-ACP methyl ester carboxylesterase